MNKQDILFQFFSRHFPFKNDGLEDLLNLFEEDSYQKEEIILQPNSTDFTLRFVKSGFLREYYTTNSKEVNINFYGANEFSTDLNSFFGGSNTQKWQQCLTAVNVLSLSKKQLDQFLKNYSCGHDIVQSSFQKALASKELFERNKLTKSTEELYKELQQKKPEWLQHIPQYHIASYLNVTPETLSRVRKRIY